MRVLLIGLALFCVGLATFASAADVRGMVSVLGRNGAVRADLNDGVVVWLAPLLGEANTDFRAPSDAPHPILVQKNKRFHPHVLAVQVGSIVDFPNQDPFFHNVFSLFNGKRFDLGLYEAGSTRSVHFDRPGICYIFCNIHPQMSAIVVVLDTPYFTIADGTGRFLIPNVPAGNYRLNLWEEHCTAETLRNLAHHINVDQAPTAIGPIKLLVSKELVTPHPNKYGKSYDPEVFSNPLYSQP